MRRRLFLKLTGLLGIGGTGVGAGAISYERRQNRYYSGPVSDHFDGIEFFNPEGEEPKGLLDVVKWQLNGQRKKWPASYPSPFDDTPPERVHGNELRVSFVGHATILVQTQSINFLTDPVWSKRASPFQWAGPARVNDPGIKFENLPPIDFILLSHNHYDHLDLATLQKLHAKFEPLIITPLGNDTILKDHFSEFNITVGDWGDSVAVSNSVNVTFEPAHHWSARGVADRRNALWAAFVIHTPDGLIYHIGDTGFHNGINYRAAQEKYGEFRLAILPFGAYEPRYFMRGQHQNPDEAVRGHLLCKTHFTLGHHWGTFQLTDESIEDQIEHLDEALLKHGVSKEEFRALQPGEVWNIPLRREVSA